MKKYYNSQMLNWNRNRKRLLSLAQTIADSDFFAKPRKDNISRALWSKIISFYHQNNENELLEGHSAIFAGEKSDNSNYQAHSASLRAMERKLDAFYDTEEGKKESRKIEVRFFFAKRTKNKNQPRDYRLLVQHNSDFIVSKPSNNQKSTSPKTDGAADSRRILEFTSTAEISDIPNYELSKEDIQKEITALTDKLDTLLREQESAKALGISISGNVLTAEIDSLNRRLTVLKENMRIFDIGYEVWNKNGFESTCEEGGFDYLVDTIGEITDGAFRLNPESLARIPKSVHLNLKAAIDLKLFDKIVVYAVRELRDLEEEEIILNKFCFFDLFGITSRDEKSLFLIGSWTSNELK